MHVRLIDYTGIHASDPADYAARLLIYAKNTRLTQGEETRQRVAGMSTEERNTELDAISKTIRSSWEFIGYTFEIIGVTRAFTHQFVRTRTASYAQQAQRVVNMTDFATRKPKTVENDPLASRLWDDLMTHISTAYGTMRELNVPAQDCRGVLPTNVLTNIISHMNLRTLADLVGKRDNLRAQDEYHEVIVLMRECVERVHPWVHCFLYPERTQTPNVDAILSELLGTASPVDTPRLNAALKELDALKGIWG